MESTTLSAQTIVADLLAEYPQAAGVLIKLRTGCVGCEMNRFCTIADVCRQYGLDLADVLRKLEIKNVPQREPVRKPR